MMKRAEALARRQWCTTENDERHVSIRVMQWVKKKSLHALFDFATRVHTACLTAGVGCSSAWHFSLGKSAGTRPLAQPET